MDSEVVESGQETSEPTSESDNGVEVTTSVVVLFVVGLGPVEVVLAMEECCQCVFVNVGICNLGVC